MGGVFANQLLDRPGGWKLPRVPDHQLVLIHADLNRDSRGVILVDDRVEDGLAEGGPGNWQGLNSLRAPVGDSRLQVFGGEQVHGAFHLPQEISPYFVVIEKVVVGPEKADH